MWRTSRISAVVVILAAGCPPTPAGEAEGEGQAAEGEGQAGEGEGQAGEGEGEGQAGEGEGEGQAPTTTWYRDVLPLARTHCEVCHTVGGIGPYDIEDEVAVVGEQELMVANVEARLMPPWKPASTCGGHTYAGDRSLSTQEIATFTSWGQNNFALGDPADANGTVPALALLDRVDATLTIPAPGYVPSQAQNDDYHCFLLDPVVFDPAFASRQFVVGVDIHPGTASMVHHVLLYVADRAAAQSQESSTPGLGWTCFGGDGVSGGSNIPTVVGAWAPGSNATLYPAGTGLAVETSQVIVMQVHYNFAAAPTPLPADRTSALLKLESTVATAALLTVIPPNTNFTLPPGVSSDSSSFPALGRKLWGLLPHMHQLGTRITVSAATAGCLIDVPDWDFHWQQAYFFDDVANGIRLGGSEAVTTSCTWNNTTGGTVSFGESTSDEMCLTFAYTTP